ncbi:MAG: matrixin family metalloprotease [Deltaproteobacteria bacterium]|nr:MAG: matrixin family metalloprotease [Deltaproteobacteria bacterium]TNF25231.1 MAG: matrixin family metalloprotease [Deltaproteobacteria bacterium]
MKTLLTLLFLSYAIGVKAYVLTRGSNKSFIRWPTTSPNLTLYLNPSNNNGLSDTEVYNIINSSVAEWSSNSAVNMGVSLTSTTGLDGRNEISFTTNSLYFPGSGVVGVTNVAFREQDGAILEADILLNDNMPFYGSSTLLSSEPSEYYLGNVITHELGHVIGLGHSQVHSSSMFYKLYRGQHTLEHDDIAGAQAYYPNQSNGVIQGTVVGSSKLIGIIGTQVEAISASSGKVVAAALTNDDGTFAITGLSLNDQYFLYLKPLQVLETLPGIYSDSRKDFCNSNTAYRGGFFQSCYNSDEGFPIGIDLTSSSSVVNVGNVSINCGLKVPPSYFLSKGSSFDLNVIDDYGNAGNTFVGFFTNSQIKSTESDEIIVDLTDYSVSSGDYYLDVKLVYQPFYSEMYLEMDVEFTSGPNKKFPVNPIEYNSDKNPTLDFHERFILNNADPSSNYFKFKITPMSLLRKLKIIQGDITPEQEYEDQYLDRIAYMYKLAKFYPELTTFGDSLHFYLMIVTISKKNADGSYTTQSTRKYKSSDNTACADGPLTYKVSANTYRQESSSTRKLAEADELGLPVACGSIDFIDRDPPSGGMRNGMLVGLALSFILLAFYRRRFD